MIVNPYTQKEMIVPYKGTKLLQVDFGLLGMRVKDPFDFGRVWRIEGFYAPTTISGVRTKIIDQKNFCSFINQMDLEVLLEIAKPGTLCQWSGRRYSGPGDRDFYGACCDDEDLADDLFDRELILRASDGYGFLPPRAEIVRRIHIEDRVDVEELIILLWDGDPETGISPDPRRESVTRRWSRVQRERAAWEGIR